MLNSEATQMFYIDTPTKEIRAYSFDNLSGSIGEAKIIVNTENHGWEGSPDGMTIDSEDMLWVAMCMVGPCYELIQIMDPFCKKLIYHV